MRPKLFTHKMGLRLSALLPMGVPRYVRCYDNGGLDALDGSSDRYMVCYTGRYRKPLSPELQKSGHYGRMEWFQHVGMSGSPFDPKGIGMHGESQRQIDTNKHGFAPAIGRKCHLGRRIRFQDLPADCQRLVLSDYREIWRLPA